MSRSGFDSFEGLPESWREGCEVLELTDTHCTAHCLSACWAIHPRLPALVDMAWARVWPRCNSRSLTPLSTVRIHTHTHTHTCTKVGFFNLDGRLPEVGENVTLHAVCYCTHLRLRRPPRPPRLPAWAPRPISCTRSLVASGMSCMSAGLASADQMHTDWMDEEC